MPKSNTRDLLTSLRSGDLAKVRASLKSDPTAACAAQAVGVAAGMAWTEAVSLLVRHGADLNASFRNYRPLHALIQGEPHAERGNAGDQKLSCLKWMLDNGADPEQLGGWPATRATITAAFAGVAAYAEILRQHAVFDGFVAAALGDLSAVRSVLDQDPGFATARDQGGLTALHCAAGSRLGAGDKRIQTALLSIADVLLDHGAEVGARVRSWSHNVDAVYFAVWSGQRELFALLLKRGADPTQALTPAIWRGATDLAELALGRGAEFDRATDETKPLLNQMIRWGRFKQAMWMLERGASPNVADERGWTAVHQAASRGNEKMLKAVLEAGGDPDRHNNAGYKPLDIARGRRRPKIVALLGG